MRRSGSASAAARPLPLPCKMSWKIAKKEARHWIDGLNLQSVSGRLIDLREPAKSLRFSSDHFRTMVFRAAERLLKTRGATAILPDPPESPPPGA